MILLNLFLNISSVFFIIVNSVKKCVNVWILFKGEIYMGKLYVFDYLLI